MIYGIYIIHQNQKIYIYISDQETRFYPSWDIEKMARIHSEKLIILLTMTLNNPLSI